jgi:hypothetical protein
MTLQLDIRQDNQFCTFRFTWNIGQQITASLPYPETLTANYREWRNAYLNFYQHFIPPQSIEDSTLGLRGRVLGSGSLSTSDDRRSALVQAEARLLSEFYRWLNSAQLAELRQKMLGAAKQQAKSTDATKVHQPIDLFLSCYPTELERLPWESWEINSELDTTTTIRIVRIPVNIDESIDANTKHFHRRRPRILVILGDDTGLDLDADCQAIRSLSRLAQIEWINWRQKKDLSSLSERIITALADECGWDVLLFAGHSNESEVVGGELAIAPGQSIALSELKPHLIQAKKRGLKFALFNSCNGLDIAKSLIQWGIHQVAVMREPIHNHVAQAFLIEFLRHLGRHEDAHQSLLTACQELKLVKNLTYPSAHLVPCLFRHPAAQPFQIAPGGWKATLKKWMPSPKQAIAVAGVAALSLLFPIQDRFLDQRLWTQAVYRRITGQVEGTGEGKRAETTPIALVQVDDRSLREAGLRIPNPIDRRYLAQLIDRLSQTNVKVIGIDYLLDRTAEPEEDQAIVQSMTSAANQGTWFVFVTKFNENSGEWFPVLPNAHLPSPLPNWILEGDGNLIGLGEGDNFRPTYVSLLYPEYRSHEHQPYDAKSRLERLNPLPFAYGLALAQQFNPQFNPQFNREPAPPNFPKPQPTLQNQPSLLVQLLQYFEQQQQDYTTLLTPRSRVKAVTYFSYLLNQLWLHPIMDYSLPPDQVYQTIPAWQILADSEAVEQLSQTSSIVIIAPGGYAEAGLSPGADNMRLPKATRYWHQQTARTSSTLTGAEAHAYMLHHYLADRLVIPIPDLWMIGLAALLGRGTVLLRQGRSIRRQGIFQLVGATALYGVISLQVFISAAILLPWLFPSMVYWLYILPLCRKLR